jgi:uncharacterized lipoprotein YajG
LLEKDLTMKTPALALVALFALGACATTDPQRSYTPPTTVVIKTPKARSAQANYQVSPEEANLTGSGGSAK